MIGQGRIWVKNAEIAACRVAEGVAVHEVGHAANGLSHNDGRCQQVAEGPRVDMEVFRLQIPGNSAKEEAPLYSHAALPYEGNFQEMVVIIGPVEKKHIP